MNLKAITTAFLLCTATHLFAQAPKYSNEFLSIGVGARALGMSGAQVAIVDDVTSGFWNPAGLTLGKGDLQLALMHSEYFAGIAKFDYAAVAAPIDATSTVALNVIRFAIDNIIDTTDLIDPDGNINYDRLKSFSAADFAFIFSYAKKTKIAGLRYGGSAKVVYRKVGSYATAWGFGLDAGAQYEKNNWRFGVFGKDITSTFNAWSFNTDQLTTVFQETGNEIPQNGLEITLPKLILGAAYKANMFKNFSIQPVADFNITFDGRRNVLVSGKPASIDPNIGLEVGYSDFIFLRGGIHNIQKVVQVDNSTSTTIQPSMGVGLRLKNITIDYALSNTVNSLYSNIFSLKLNIFKKPKTTQTNE